VKNKDDHNLKCKNPIIVNSYAMHQERSQPTMSAGE